MLTMSRKGMASCIGKWRAVCLGRPRKYPSALLCAFKSAGFRSPSSISTPMPRLLALISVLLLYFSCLCPIATAADIVLSPSHALEWLSALHRSFQLPLHCDESSQCPLHQSNCLPD